MSKLIFMLALLCLIFSSCTEDLLDETQITSSKEGSILQEDARSSLTACDFDLASIPAGTTKKIQCLIDLKGQVVILNNNVILDYEGGDIENGTIIFTNGKISGKLMSKSLILQGSVQLIDPTFQFITSRWDIVEGKVNKRVALNNRLYLKEVIEQIKRMNGNTFIIDKLDAYFEVTTVTHPSNPNFYPSVEAINIPANFNLVMTENTHLRTFPNSSKKSSLLAIRNVSNATITGGTLHGDRDEHEYVGSSSHEWGHLVDLHSARFATVDGVKMINATGDGLIVHSLGFSFQPSYLPSHNILITNCVFDSSRRNNLAITDGHDIIIEHSEFYRAGVDTQNSKGTNPRFAIDIEAERSRENGELILYEKVENVIIRHNTESGGARGGFLIAIGDNVTIENNTVQDGIAYKYTNNSIIRNNRLIANGRGGVAMGLGAEDSRTISNNKVIGNYFEGYSVAMSIYGDDHLIQGNIIKNCVTGINGKNFSNTKILNNRITSTDPLSRGIFIHYTSVNRVLIKNNIVNVPNNPFKFDLINLNEGQEEFCAHLVNNEFNSSYDAIIKNSNGVSLMQNKINTGLEIWDSKNSIIEHNVINSKNSDGIHLLKRNEVITLADNIINVPSNKQCVRIASSTNKADIEEKNNQCLN